MVEHTASFTVKNARPSMVEEPDYNIIYNFGDAFLRLALNRLTINHVSIFLDTQRDQ